MSMCTKAFCRHGKVRAFCSLCFDDRMNERSAEIAAAMSRHRQSRADEKQARERNALAAWNGERA